MKCNQSRPRFELVSPCPFPTTITITPRATPSAHSNLSNVEVYYLFGDIKAFTRTIFYNAMTFYYFKENCLLSEKYAVTRKIQIACNDIISSAIITQRKKLPIKTSFSLKVKKYSLPNEDRTRYYWFVWGVSNTIIFIEDIFCRTKVYLQCQLAEIACPLRTLRWRRFGQICRSAATSQRMPCMGSLIQCAHL